MTVKAVRSCARGSHSQPPLQRLALAAASIGILAGCASPGQSTQPQPGPIAGIAMVGGLHQLHIMLPDSFHISAHAVDAQGDSIAGQYPITFTARNPSVAWVDTLHYVHTVKTGYAWVVAGLSMNGQTFTDSAEFIVVGG